jgi:hypothetical protein
MPDVAGAAADPHKENPPSAAEVKAIEQAIRETFSVERIAKALEADVNLRGNVERVVTHKALVDWAKPENSAANQDFPAHVIFYDEDESPPDAPKPPEGTEYEPWLTENLAIKVLAHLFLGGQAKGKGAGKGKGRPVSQPAGAGGQTAGGGGGASASYSQGDAVQGYSVARGIWINAHVVATAPSGEIKIQYEGGQGEKWVRPHEQSKVVRRRD